MLEYRIMFKLDYYGAICIHSYTSTISLTVNRLGYKTSISKIIEIFKAFYFNEDGADNRIINSILFSISEIISVISLLLYYW